MAKTAVRTRTPAELVEIAQRIGAMKTTRVNMDTVYTFTPLQLALFAEALTGRKVFKRRSPAAPPSKGGNLF